MRRDYERYLTLLAAMLVFSLAINGFAAEGNSPLATDSSWQDDNQRGIAARGHKNIVSRKTIVSRPFMRHSIISTCSTAAMPWCCK